MIQRSDKVAEILQKDEAGIQTLEAAIDRKIRDWSGSEPIEVRVGVEIEAVSLQDVIDRYRATGGWDVRLNAGTSSNNFRPLLILQ